MNCEEIETILRELKVNSRGSIRGKSRVIDKINSKHLTDIDNALMDVRVFVAKLSTGHTTKEALKMIDEFIYNKQIK